MLPPLASDFRQIAPPPHHACAARSASHGLTRARLSSSTHILADAIHHGIYSGKVNSSMHARNLTGRVANTQSWLATIDYKVETDDPGALAQDLGVLI